MARKTTAVGGDKQKSVYILGGFFCVVIIAIAITWIVSISGKSTDKTESSRINKANNSGQLKTEQNTAYIKQLDGYNTTKGSTAFQKGSSWISIPAYYSEEIKQPPSSQQQPKFELNTSRLSSQVTSIPGAKPAAVARKEAEEILNAAEAAWLYSTPTDAESKDVTTYATAFMPKVATLPALNAAASSLTPAIVPYKIYDALKLCPAKLMTQLDTDTNSMVRATLMCDELSNAVVLASGYKLVGEDIDMMFTLMTYKSRSDKESKTYKIVAKPLDLDTGRSMLTGNVDRHYVRRILLPATSLAVAKVGNLYEKSSSQTSYVSQGTVVTSSDGKVSPDQVKGTFVGGLAQQTADVLKEENSRLPPVSVKRIDQPTFGVVFLEPVMSSDALEKNVPTGDAMSQKNTPQYNLSEPAGKQQVNEQRFHTPAMTTSGPVFSSVNPE